MISITKYFISKYVYITFHNITVHKSGLYIAWFDITLFSHPSTEVSNLIKVQNEIGTKMPLAYLFQLELINSISHYSQPRNGEYLTPWWRHQIKAFPALLALCAGNSSVTDEFHSQKTSNADCCGCFLLWIRISCSTKSRMTGDLRRHYVHVTSS